MNDRQKYIFFISTLILATIALFVVNTEKIVIVVSESMSPTIKKGTIAIIDKEDISNIEIDDIICYISAKNKSNIIHRVVDKQLDENNQIVLTVQGDNNRLPDNEVVTQHNYVGKLGINIWFTDIILELLPKIVVVLGGILTCIHIKIKGANNDSSNR